jgi:hypothetical protein
MAIISLGLFLLNVQRAFMVDGIYGFEHQKMFFFGLKQTRLAADRYSLAATVAFWDL